MTDSFIELNGMSADCFQLISQGGCFFIGASVTAQKSGWTDKLVELITERLKSSFVVGKKAMGGVGLTFGVTKWPHIDLPVGGVVFIEFSVGDLNLGLTPLDRLETLLESLIIDIISQKNFPIIVHNWRSDFRKEKGEIVRNIYNAVASKFHVPVIRNDIFVESQIVKDANIDKSWFRDNCHTTSEGAFAYAKHIFDAICVISSQQNTGVVNVKKADKRLGEVEPLFDLDKYFNSDHYVSYTYTYRNTGQEFIYYECDGSVEFKAFASGELMSIAFLSGPTSGWVELLIDGESKKMFRCFDRHSYYKRFIMLPAFYQLSNSTLTIRLSEKPVDFSIAKQEHSDFQEQRKMQLVSLIGVGLKLSYS
jgi:hypothetical protein